MRYFISIAIIDKNTSKYIDVIDGLVELPNDYGPTGAFVEAKRKVLNDWRAWTENDKKLADADYFIQTVAFNTVVC